MKDLSVIIPARNEEWINETIDTVISNRRLDTEVIAVLDGYWPDKGIPSREGVKVIHHSTPIGQRAATNEGVRLSDAKYVMKLDAHCSISEGFDQELIRDAQYDWTIVPTMYNLHVFDWQCEKCGDRRYMGPYPKDCPKCDNKSGFKKVLVWQPRRNRRSDYMRFDKSLHFQYWHDYRKRPEAQGEICDQMCCVGACWMMQRERYWELGGMDEGHGSWGQMGVEVACKSWLSGGKQIVNKRAWFAHLFRTQDGFGFPYPNPGITKAREYSQKLWMEGTWPKAKYPLSWLIEKFKPVPDWN